MWIWEEQLKNHPVHSRIVELEEKLQETLAVINNAADLLEILQRSEVVLLFIKNRLSEADPNLVSGNVLGAIDQQISSATQQLTSYLSNKNIAHIKNNLVSNIDAALAQANAIPIRSKRGDIKQLIEEAEQYRDFIRNLIK